MGTQTASSSSPITSKRLLRRVAEEGPRRRGKRNASSATRSWCIPTSGGLSQVRHRRGLLKTWSGSSAARGNAQCDSQDRRGLGLPRSPYASRTRRRPGAIVARGISRPQRSGATVETSRPLRIVEIRHSQGALVGRTDAHEDDFVLFDQKNRAKRPSSLRANDSFAQRSSQAVGFACWSVRSWIASDRGDDLA